MLETAQSYIYGLFDPADQVIRYVGQTTRPNARLCMHKSANPNPINGSVAKDWIAGMLREDRYPCMIILEICDFAVAYQREADWYRRLCDGGQPPLNKPSAFNKPNTSRKAKPYKDPLTHQVFSIIEVGYFYISHDPSAPESKQRFGTILEAMEKLGNGNLSLGIRKAIDMNMQAMAQKFGTVEYQDETYTLTQVADYSNRVFPGWFGDAQEGEAYTTEFSAKALDDDGNEYQVYWMFDTVKGEEPADNGNWPWDEVARIVPQ